MQKTIILWLTSFVILFITGYIYQITDSEYPVTGTIGIESKKVSYKFDKAHIYNEPYKFVLRTDLDDLTGKLLWRPTKLGSKWNSINLDSSKNVLTAIIPKQQLLDTIEYKALILHKGKIYDLPDGNPVSLTFFSKVNIPVQILEHLFLYTFILLAIRIGLEYFSEKSKAKKFAVVCLAVLILYVMMFHPLYLSYKAGYINHSVPDLAMMFPSSSKAYLVLWIITTLVLFNTKKFKSSGMIAGILTLIVFLFIRN